MVFVVQNSIALPASADAPVDCSGSKLFLRVKRACDIGLAVVALLPFSVLILAVWLINFRFNPGSLFFLQQRMGRDCKPFTIVKFRTMLPIETVQRGFEDPVETDRITPFGALMRRTRIDELPQILNILLGHMSFVGPRPDSYEHAVKFADLVPGYRDRHQVRPGITGLAQVNVGYAVGLDATTQKVAADLVYIRDMSALLDMRIIFGTAWVMVSGWGSR